MKIEVETAYQENDIAAGEVILAVPWKITEGEDMLIEGVQGFPLKVTTEEITDFLKQKLATYKENVALHEGAKDLQAGLDNAAKVAGEITGITIEE